MDKLLTYLLQVSAGSAILYLCFILFYRNDTFYIRNRIMLILIMVLPAIFPLLSVGTSQTIPGAAAAIIIVDRLVTAGQTLQSSVRTGIGIPDYYTWIVIVWLSGFSLLLVRAIVSIAGTSGIILKGEQIRKGCVRIIVSDLQHPPFSFGPFAVIPRSIYDSRDNTDILRHEIFHVRQLHTIDLILSELYNAVFWFNPVAWLLKRSIILNHEYLADKCTIHNCAGIKEYQYQLLNLNIGLSSIHLIHNFNSNLKSRIAMINKKTTSKIAGLKTLLILPAIALIMSLFSFRSNPGPEVLQDNQTLFSTGSHKKIMEMIFTNIKYPPEAKKLDITGKFFVVIKMGKGGVVEKVTVNDTDKSINIPTLGNEVVVAGYGLKNPPEDSKATVPETGRALLTDEGVRVAKILGSLKLPEWENTGMEFAIQFNFTLQYPEEKTIEIKVKDNSFRVSPDVRFLIDGKESSKKQFDELSPDLIETVSVLKGESATKVFGDKGKNGVIIVTTKR